MTQLAQIGEKRLIAEVIAPLFNPEGAVEGVGDDCAVLVAPKHCDLVASTDRVPADLTAFRTGLLDHRGLGDYLARLNLSDVAAAGGTPIALLFNAGLPPSLDVDELRDLCEGFAAAAARCGTRVVGGDLSFSETLSLSATVLGAVPQGRMLTRRGASVGDVIFTTRPLGLTPAAFATVTAVEPAAAVSSDEHDMLCAQFTGMEPLVDIGLRLRELGATSLMDNTDGLGQTLAELAAAADRRFVITLGSDALPPLVRRVADALATEPLDFALGPGADFALVGTAPANTAADLPSGAIVLGHVEAGSGVMIDNGSGRHRHKARGWEYFAADSAAEVAA